MREVKVIRPGFVLIENFFDDESAKFWIEYILKKGEDPQRGFHHPFVRPNRFHKAPKYPVKKYMCFGQYWNPLDYLYYPEIPEYKVKPFPVPDFFQDLAQDVIKLYFNWTKEFWIESALVNFYTQDSSMGLHIDKDEEDQVSPVIGVNFGSTCRFLYETMEGEMEEIKIPSHSVYIFGNEARQMRHGVGTIYAKTVPQELTQYFNNKERLNLTLRKIFK